MAESWSAFRKLFSRTPTQLNEIDNARSELTTKSSNLALPDGEKAYWAANNVADSLVRRIPIIAGVAITRFAEYYRDFRAKDIEASPNWDAIRSLSQYAY